MAYKVQELRPKKTVLTLVNRDFELSPLTLQKEVEFIEEFGSLKEALENKDKILNVLWVLVKDKDYFESFNKFQEIILTWNALESLDIKVIKIINAINEVVRNSSPLIKNQKRYKEIMELRKATGGQEAGEPCYGVYYDRVAKRYGYTLDDFYNLTMRQLHSILQVIGDEEYKELEVQASLAGRELKPRMEFADISEEQEKENEKQAVEAFNRLQKEYEERKKQQENK